MVRGKFRLNKATSHAGYKGKDLEFGPVYDPSIPEDQNFSEATPSGKLEMHVNNPQALAEFEVGQCYYLDFTPANTKG